MGEGYWILVWDGWGSGLSMFNPRLHVENGKNWWPRVLGTTRISISTKHKLKELYGEYYSILYKLP